MTTERPLKMMKNALYFNSKALLFSRYILFVLTLCPCIETAWLKLSDCNWTRTQNHWVKVQLDSFNLQISHLSWEGVPWHSGNYGVWIHSETRTWHDKNIQLRLRLIWKVNLEFYNITAWLTNNCITHIAQYIKK